MSSFGKPFYAQITVEKGFNTREEAVRWLQSRDDELTAEGDVDTISSSIWEPGS